MKSKILGLLAVGLLAGPMAAQAVPVRFDYAGVSGSLSYSGSLVINNSLFNGTNFQGIQQSNLIGFVMTMQNAATTFTWNLSDVIPSSSWYFDSSGATPDIVGQGGFISITYSLIAAGTGYLGSNFGTVLGDWTYAGPVPEPGTLALLGLGLVGLGLSRRRKAAKATRST